MSTRGCIAVKKGKGWVGVYNHFDSYPTGLGQELFQALHESPDLKATAKNLLKLGDWRNVKSGGKCCYCGKTGLGQAHDITGSCLVSPKASPAEMTYPDPDCKDHQHDGVELMTYSKTMERDQALWLEWVYVIDVEHAILKVYTNARAKGEHTVKGERGDFKSPNYQWLLVENLSIKGEALDWEALDKKGGAIGDEAYDKYSPKEKATA